MSLIKKIREAVNADSIGRRKDGCIVIRRGFFYTNGVTAESFAAKVAAALKDKNVNAHVVDSGEVWKPFRGGSSIANSSHWFVVLSEEKVVTA